MEDAPWSDWYGKPLTARGLAVLLEPIRIVPMQRRVGAERFRGYFRSDFEDAWPRYFGLAKPETFVTVVPRDSSPIVDCDGEESSKGADAGIESYSCEQVRLLGLELAFRDDARVSEFRQPLD